MEVEPKLVKQVEEKKQLLKKLLLKKPQLNVQEKNNLEQLKNKKLSITGAFLFYICRNILLMDSILLFSGGKESVYQLHYKQKEIGKLVMFNYGQKSFPSELQALKYYASLYDKEWEVIKLHFFQDLLPPAIKDGIDCNPYVAQRNLIFSSIALGYAEVNGFKKVYLGAVADSVEYDACPWFIDNLNWASKSVVKLVSHSRKYSTEQILRSLIKNKIDISHLWSCDNYTHAKEKKHCGKCAKCTSALRNLKELYADDKDVRKFYDIKYFAEDITKVFSDELGQTGTVCKRR